MKIGTKWILALLWLLMLAAPAIQAQDIGSPDPETLNSQYLANLVYALNR